MLPSGESLYNVEMQVAFGKIVDGRVELDADLPEGASVTVLVMEGNGTFEADSDTEKMLLKAVAQCDRNETTPMAQFLDGLAESTRRISLMPIRVSRARTSKRQCAMRRTSNPIQAVHVSGAQNDGEP